MHKKNKNKKIATTSYGNSFSTTYKFVNTEHRKLMSQRNEKIKIRYLIST